MNKKINNTINQNDGLVMSDNYGTQIFNNTVLVPQQLTTKSGTNTIIGRKIELNEIEKKLTDTNPILIINGIGGIGKTTIASYFFYTKKKQYDFYGFFEGIDSFISELREPLQLKSERETDIFLEALTKLRNLKGKKLLVIDNIEDVDSHQDFINKVLSLIDNNFHIILTSREVIEDVANYELDILNIDDAKKLFNSIYTIKDDKLLEELLQYLDCHAFFVEKTAKTLKSKRTLTPQELKEKFSNGKFSKISIKRNQSFKKYLTQLFTFDKLDNEEISILKQFTALPSINIEFSFIENIFYKVDKEELEELLNYLVEKGWMSKTTDSYKLHQIIKEYIVINHTPTFPDISDIVSYFLNLIIDSHIVQTSIEVRNKLNYFLSLSTLFHLTNLKNITIAEFYYHLGMVYRILSNYDQALFFHNESLKLYQDLDVTEQTERDIGIVYNSLGGIYKQINNFKEATICFEKTINIFENKLKTIDYDLEGVHNNLAGLYKLEGKYYKALELYNHAISTRKQAYGNNDTILLNIYHNKAVVYAEMNQDKKSIKIYHDILKKLHTNFEKNSYLIAKCNHNMAVSYKKINNAKKAILYFKKSLKITEKMFDNNHIDIAMSQHDLAIVYANQKKYQMSKEYIQKALSSYNVILPLNHPRFKSAQNILNYLILILGKKTQTKVGRNDPCLCGSGKKYKNCCQI